MTDPSQYFKGRTVQEQMNEVIGYVDTRSAEVATAAIASDVAQVHQDMLDADADAQAAAASAAAAAGTLANAVKKTGEASQSIAGDIAVAGDLSGGSVTVPTPVNNTDAANKKYVDDQDALDVHLAGNEAITGIKTVPLESTGTVSNQIASSQKVRNEISNDAILKTGAQTKTGYIIGEIATEGGSVYRNKSMILDHTQSIATTNKDGGSIDFQDKNGVTVVRLSIVQLANTTKIRVNLWILNTDNTWNIMSLGESSA